ncbi:hypothetical protein QTO34_008344 [Cnephaeus nilssonii]|uniref:Uncharacterized protein n=1 Tax=Cnephaeus nilssonii TaxID=3371016 RepID=A0AA40IA49_CNENI|nr:hypothetical protein QTO34_008344 [Eptesicus nilssonii]
MAGSSLCYLQLCDGRVLGPNRVLAAAEAEGVEDHYKGGLSTVTAFRLAKLRTKPSVASQPPEVPFTASIAYTLKASAGHGVTCHPEGMTELSLQPWELREGAGVAHRIQPLDQHEDNPGCTCPERT